MDRETDRWMDGWKDSQTDGDSYIITPLELFFSRGGGTVIIHHTLYIEKKYIAKISLNQFTQSNYKVAPEI